MCVWGKGRANQKAATREGTPSLRDGTTAFHLPLTRVISSEVPETTRKEWERVKRSLAKASAPRENMTAGDTADENTGKEQA